MDILFTRDSSIILSVLVASIFFILFKLSRRGKNLPIGPRPLPFFGNTLSLGERVPETLTKWSKQFGDVYTFYAGNKPIVILSNLETVRRLLGDEVSSGREREDLIRTADSALPWKMGNVMSDGELWRTHRRFMMSTLRDLGMGKNWLEDSILVEVEGLLQTLRETRGLPFNPQASLMCVANLICTMVFGKRFELDDPRFSWLISKLGDQMKAGPATSMLQAMPFLMWFPNSIRTQVMSLRHDLKEIADFLAKEVEDHKVNPARTDVPDYILAFLTQTSKNTPTFTEQQLHTSIFDIIIGGSDTILSTILWAFVFMIENPDIMRKVQEEIDEKVGRDRMLTTAEKGLLPYTEAVILEVERCASVLPLAVPHRLLEETIVDGFVIPKDTIIAPNIYAIHRDSRYWKNPDRFDPDRFLDADKQNILRPNAFMPFSTGKRVCIGEGLAKAELFLFISNVLRCFSLELPPGQTLSHEDYISSIISTPKPFQLLFKARH
ncbi:Cytochrome P450 2B19 [Hypsibius exemplaris]|uniref:Cytochrome P450 2B19 n=1 Tax=Hypsibius exemplaris TaxID=2072580 RepID=A0A9X6RM19_HYPEX|nr:Cytochrome P450 2B19 [Hypsibius exemplaris]